MRRSRADLTTAVVTVAGAVIVQLMLVPVGAAATTSPPTSEPVTSSAVASRPAPKLSDERYLANRRFAREPVRRGDRDRGTDDIEHVRELQYRLRWAGAYRGPVTGYFGDRTQTAVKRFQRRADLHASGKATRAVWVRLIKRTVRNKSADRCRHRPGLHACYDRNRHQVMLWKRGTLWNSWLVRGGDREYQTRTGHFTVYRRDIDHVSSIFNTPMPYAQFFSGGQALHGSAYMTDPFVDHSHGCVNMYIEDARQLWQLTNGRRLRVHVYGRWS